MDAVSAAPAVGPPGHLLLPLERIRPNPDHPRRECSEAALEELADSIRVWGQIQPVVVRPLSEPGMFQLICGERRWRAHQRAGLRTIWAVERDATDADSLRLALIENVQRVALSAAEKLAALDQLAEMVEVTGLRRTAAQLHMDPGWLSRLLALRRDPIILPQLEAGGLGFGQASELLRAPNHIRKALVERVCMNPSVTTAEVRAWVEQARSAGRAGQPAEGSSAYRAVFRQLEHLNPPTSEDDRRALWDIFRCVQRLLRVPSTAGAGRLEKTAWVELSCLSCGEHAASSSTG